MLNKTVEFLRIADLQPSDDKVRRRAESATELVAYVAKDENSTMLLAFLQGIIGGFEKPLFTQETSAVVMLIKAIKDKDATLPHDLTENALELRAIAAIAVGELLTSHLENPTHEATVAALSIRSALSSRPAASNKHIRWMLETLLAAGDKVLDRAAHLRRKRGTPALEHLAHMEKPEEDGDLWELLLPAVQSALGEASAQEEINREEVETLWWMFTGYSEIEQKPLAELSSSSAAFCSGIELAGRALLPPSLSSVAMVKRAVESGRKPATLVSVSLQEIAAEWSESMTISLSPVDGSADDVVSRHPSLLPISWTCQHLRKCKDAPKLGKEVPAATGIPLNHSQSAASWGAQVFREKILQRVIMGTEEK